LAVIRPYNHHTPVHGQQSRKVTQHVLVALLTDYTLTSLNVRQLRLLSQLV